MILTPNHPRFIFECEPEHFILAGKAARWMVERPYQTDAILAYGEGKSEIAFYAKRNKSSISIRQERK